MWNCNESTTNRGYSRGFPNTDERINTEVKYSHDSNGIESTCNAGDLGSIPGLRRNPGGEHSNTLQYSCLEDPHGQSSLAGYSPGSRKESVGTEQLTLSTLSATMACFPWKDEGNPRNLSSRQIRSLSKSLSGHRAAEQQTQNFLSRASSSL